MPCICKELKKLFPFILLLDAWNKATEVPVWMITPQTAANRRQVCLPPHRRWRGRRDTAARSQHSPCAGHDVAIPKDYRRNRGGSGGVRD